MPDESGSWRIALGTALACLPLLALAQFTSHIRADEFDAWLFAYYGKQIAGGLTLYEQLWDNKPPGIFWINALVMWLSGGSLTGVVVLSSATAAATCAVFYALAKRLYGPWAAACGTVMAALYLYQQLFHVGCNRPSTFFVLTELASVLLYARALQRGTGILPVPASVGSWGHTGLQTVANWPLLVASGFVGGLGAWFMQSALAATAAILLHQVLLTATRRQTARQGALRVALIAAGWFGAAGTAVALLAVTSDLAPAWHAIVAFNRLYFLPEVGSKWWPEWFGLREQTRVLALPVILALATLLHAAAARLTPQPDDRPKVPDVGTRPYFWLAMLWVWLLVATYLALIGPHQRLHYLGIALPPLCVLATHGLWLFLATGRRTGGAHPPYYLFVGVLWCGYMLLTPLGDQLNALNRHYYYRYEDRTPNPRVVTADLIRQHTAPGDTIFVWAYDPEVYFRADRPPAIRYIATEKAYQLGPAGQPIMDEIIAALKHAAPAVMVLPPDAATQLGHPDRQTGLDFGDLGFWIEGNYRPLERPQRSNIWLRITP